jgi:hypothetical protein
MPTHIYTRLGEWNGVVQGNLRAAEAALEHPAGDHGEFVWDEFPHAIEYLVYAYLQQGADDEAAAQLKRLLTTAKLEPTFKTAFHLASTQARYALERRAWNEAAALVPRAPRSSIGTVLPGRRPLRSSRGAWVQSTRVNQPMPEPSASVSLNSKLQLRKAGEELCQKHPSAAPRIGRLARSRGRPSGVERCADARGRRA